MHRTEAHARSGTITRRHRELPTLCRFGTCGSYHPFCVRNRSNVAGIVADGETGSLDGIGVLVRERLWETRDNGESMTEQSDATTAGWFSDLAPGDRETEHSDSAGEAIIQGSADQPTIWPALAVESGFVDTVNDYYDRLHEATIAATRTQVKALERADDQQLIHRVRAMDDCRRTANELTERLAEWAGTLDDDSGTGVEYARRIVDGESAIDEERLESLAHLVVDLATEADELERDIERRCPSVAPNLAALAGPVLAARLLSLAGGLESLAKKPSGTIQVLGAEDALFAHLRGHAPSPKHGVIYTHDAIRNTAAEDRGSAARALAGKLAIAARIDHYSGDHRPELERELADRITTIRARTADDSVDTNTGGDLSG